MIYDRIPLRVNICINQMQTLSLKLLIPKKKINLYIYN